MVAVEKILDALDAAEFRSPRSTPSPSGGIPRPPFITSTLQKEANRKLRFPPKKTMSLAQQLYEGKDLGDEVPSASSPTCGPTPPGFRPRRWTQVRTSSTALTAPSICPTRPTGSKAPRGAQEAHEAIRPTGVTRRPQDAQGASQPDELALYELIWRRFVASQMTPAVFDLTTVDIAAADYLFRATGSVLKFAGFTKVYQESRETEDTEGPVKFPPLAAGDVLQLRDFDPQQHFTKPPARFTEASLIKELEVQGIGRPSTYATILTNLQDRLYVVKEKTALRPTEMGLVVSDLLVENFPNIMDPKFTAGLEDDLDRVAEGKVPWQQLMRDFYGDFAQHLDAAKTGMRKVKSIPTGLTCPECAGELVVRWGKNGEFVGCAAYPKCGFTGDFSRDAQGRISLAGLEPVAPSAPGEAPAHRLRWSGASPWPPGLPAPSAAKSCCCAGGGWENFWAAPGIPSANSPRILPGTPRDRWSPRTRKPTPPTPAPGKAAAGT